MEEHRPEVGADFGPSEAPIATILLVDDDSSVRETACLILRPCGYLVLTAESGAGALQRCAEHRGPIDLLLTDLRLPDMNGTVLAGRIRTLRPGLPVLFISGAIDRPPAHEPRTRFMPKPFSPSGLLACVESLLRASP